MHSLVGLRQPLAKDESVERSQNQSLGPTGGGRNGLHVLRSQALFAQVLQGPGARVDAQRLHAVGSAKVRGAITCDQTR